VEFSYKNAKKRPLHVCAAAGGTGAERSVGEAGAMSRRVSEGGRRQHRGELVVHGQLMMTVM